MALGVRLSDRLGDLAIQRRRRISPEGQPSASLWLGVLVRTQDGYGGLQVEPRRLRRRDAVTAEAAPVVVDVVRGEHVLAGLDVIHVVVGGDVAEQGQQVLADVRMVRAEEDPRPLPSIVFCCQSRFFLSRALGIGKWEISAPTPSPRLRHASTTSRSQSVLRIHS